MVKSTKKPHDAVSKPEPVKSPLTATQEAIRSDIATYPGGVTWVDADYDEKMGEVRSPAHLAVVRRDYCNVDLQSGFVSWPDALAIFSGDVRRLRACLWSDGPDRLIGFAYDPSETGHTLALGSHVWGAPARWRSVVADGGWHIFHAGDFAPGQSVPDAAVYGRIVFREEQARALADGRSIEKEAALASATRTARPAAVASGPAVAAFLADLNREFEGKKAPSITTIRGRGKEKFQELWRRHLADKRNATDPDGAPLYPNLHSTKSGPR